MKSKLLKISTFVCISIVFSMSGIVHATVLGTSDIVHTGYYAFEKIPVWGGDREGTYTHAGVYMLEKSNSTYEGNIWPDGTITGFCMELAQLNPTTLSSYDVIKPENGPLPTTFLGDSIGLAKTQYIQELWGRFYDPAWSSGATFTEKQNHEAASFSTAIWEIVYEDLPVSPLGWDVMLDGTLGNGGFRTDGDYSLANEWLYMLDGTGPMTELRVFSNGGYQDYIVAVPEPATIVLIGLGGAFSIMRRKRRSTI
jgi:hypothetical protein